MQLMSGWNNIYVTNNLNIIKAFLHERGEVFE